MTNTKNISTLAKEWQLLSHSRMVHELLMTIKQKHGTGASADEVRLLLLPPNPTLINFLFILAAYRFV